MYYEDCLALPRRFSKMYNSFLMGDFVVRHTSRKGSAVPMDQALEKAYNKPAKSSSGIIGFSRRKEAVCKWNLIKHEKGKFRNFLYNACQINDDDEYRVHHEFSENITAADKESVRAVMKNIAQRGNPFDIDEPQRLMNIATGAILQKDTEEFLLNCDTLGRSARNEFYETRLKEKSKQLLDKIPKTRKTTKKTEAKVTTDLNKETIRFLRH